MNGTGTSIGIAITSTGQFAAFGEHQHALIGPLVFFLYKFTRKPLLGIHEATKFSLNLPSIAVPGSHWRFGELTQSYWSEMPEHECRRQPWPGGALSHGPGLVATLAGADVANRSLLSFLVLPRAIALGPVLHVGLQAYPSVPMPYSLLEKAVPHP